MRSEDDLFAFAIPADVRVLAFAVRAMIGSQQARSRRFALKKHDVPVPVISGNPTPIRAPRSMPPVQPRQRFRRGLRQPGPCPRDPDFAGMNIQKFYMR